MSDRPSEPPPAPRTFAEKLNTMAEERGLSNPALSDGMKQLGYAISATYLWQLRTGRADNPTLSQLKGLAAFFGIRAVYWLDDEDGSAEQISLDALDQELVDTMRAAGIEDLARQASRLSPSGRRLAGRIIGELVEFEASPATSPVKAVPAARESTSEGPRRGR